MYFPVNVFLMKLLLWSVLILVCSSNWLMLWMSFELNTLFFLPFLKNSYYLYFSESMMKYFIIQSICSIGLILSWLIFNKSMIMIVFILLKMGLPPFHWWVIDFLKINSWMVFYILMTIQKIGLFMISFYFIFSKITFLVFILSSMFISLMLIYFFNNILMIMLFSSMIHSSWLLSSLFFSLKLWSLYFVFYMSVLFLLLLFFKKNNYFFLSQYFYSMKWSIFFILMGLPPFSIFIMKWSISIFIMKWSISIFIMFMVSSFLSLYIYFKFIYLSFLVKPSLFNISKTLNKNLFSFLLELMVFYVFLIL